MTYAMFPYKGYNINSRQMLFDYSNDWWWTVALPDKNCGRAKYFHFKRATVFGLGHRPSKHNTRYARNLVGVHGPFVHPGDAYDCEGIEVDNIIRSNEQDYCLYESFLWCAGISTGHHS